MNDPSAFDFGTMVVVSSGLSAIIALATTVWNWVTSGSRKNDKQIQDLAEKVAAHEMHMKPLDGAAEKFRTLENRVQHIDDQLQMMPSRDMMHRLEISMARMEGHIDRMDERLKPVAAIAERMQELMLQQGSGK